MKKEIAHFLKNPFAIKIFSSILSLKHKVFYETSINTAGHHSK